MLNQFVDFLLTVSFILKLGWRRKQYANQAS
jgi:hypothetical protein